MSKWPKTIVLVRHGESEYNRERALVSCGLKQEFSEAMKNTRNANIS